MKFVETGRIKFIQNQNSYLLEEMIRFPMGDTDDVLDALAYQLDIDKGLHVSRKVRDNIQKTIKKVTYKPRYPSIGI
jgi:phage terminase large subunit-like protein